MSWLHFCADRKVVCECEDLILCSCGQSKEHHIFVPPVPEIGLRDWFAGQALAGLMDSESDVDRVSMITYRIADAMLKERSVLTDKEKK